jgi:hypothetical protein
MPAIRKPRLKISPDPDATRRQLEAIAAWVHRARAILYQLNHAWEKIQAVVEDPAHPLYRTIDFNEGGGTFWNVIDYGVTPLDNLVIDGLAAPIPDPFDAIPKPLGGEKGGAA